MDISFCSRALLAVGLALLGGAVSADTRLAYGTPGAAPMQFLDAGAGAVRMSQTGESSWMLYRDADKTVYIVNDEQRSYHRIDKDMARQMGEQIAAMQAQVEAQMAMLPPAQREMMRQMMPQMPSMATAEYTVRVSDKTRKAGLWSCRDVTVLADGQPEEELCLADIKALKVPAGEYALMKRMGQTLGELAATFGAGSMAAVLDKLDGLPVEQRKPGASSPQAVLMEVIDKAHPAGHFKLPDGYSEAPLIPEM